MATGPETGVYAIRRAVAAGAAETLLTSRIMLVYLGVAEGRRSEADYGVA